jgi:hypothetical protein
LKVESKLIKAMDGIINPEQLHAGLRLVVERIGQQKRTLLAPILQEWCGLILKQDPTAPSNSEKIALLKVVQEQLTQMKDSTKMDWPLIAMTLQLEMAGVFDVAPLSVVLNLETFKKAVVQLVSAITSKQHLRQFRKNVCDVLSSVISGTTTGTAQVDMSWFFTDDKPTDSVRSETSAPSIDAVKTSTVFNAVPFNLDNPGQFGDLSKFKCIRMNGFNVDTDVLKVIEVCKELYQLVIPKFYEQLSLGYIFVAVENEWFDVYFKGRDFLDIMPSVRLRGRSTRGGYFGPGDMMEKKPFPQNYKQGPTNTNKRSYSSTNWNRNVYPRYQNTEASYNGREGDNQRPSWGTAVTNQGQGGRWDQSQGQWNQPRIQSQWEQNVNEGWRQANSGPQQSTGSRMNRDH